MAGAANITIDHDEIRRWVEERGGFPAKVKGAKGPADLLRIDFPGYAGSETLEKIPWEEFFDQFEKNDLAFLYQEEVGGETSRFNKLVARERVEEELPETTAEDDEEDEGEEKDAM